jgi:hypothetical protein
MSFLHVPSFVIADFGLDVFLYLGLALFGFGLILARSNRVLYSFKQGKFLAVKK